MTFCCSNSSSFLLRADFWKGGGGSELTPVQERAKLMDSLSDKNNNTKVAKTK